MKKILIPVGILVSIFVFIIPIRYILNMNEETSKFTRFTVTHKINAKTISVIIRSYEEKHPLEIKFIEVPKEFERKNGITHPKGFERMNLETNSGDLNRQMNQEYGWNLDETLVTRLQGSQFIEPMGVGILKFEASSTSFDRESWIEVEVAKIMREYRFSKTEPRRVNLYSKNKTVSSHSVEATSPSAPVASP